MEHPWSTYTAVKYIYFYIFILHQKIRITRKMKKKDRHKHSHRCALPHIYRYKKACMNGNILPLFIPRHEDCFQCVSEYRRVEKTIFSKWLEIGSWKWRKAKQTWLMLISAGIAIETRRSLRGRDFLRASKHLRQSASLNEGRSVTPRQTVLPMFVYRTA